MLSRLWSWLQMHTLTLKVLFIFFVIIFVATTSVSTVSLMQVAQLGDQQNKVYAHNLADAVSGQLNQSIDELDRVSRIMLGNATVQRIIAEHDSPLYTSLQRLADQYQASELILGFTSVRDSFLVQLYSKNLELLYSGPVRLVPFDYNLLRNDWFAAYRSQVDAHRMLIIPPGAVDQDLARPLFGVVRSLQRVDGTEIIGYISVTTDLRLLQDTVWQNSVTPGLVIQVTGQDGRVLADSRPGDSIDRPRNNGQMLVASTRSEMTGWRVDIGVPRATGAGLLSIAGVMRFLAIISMVVFMATLALAVLLSSQLLKPIRVMVTTMHSVQQGNFDISLDEKGLDFEVRQLYSGFNRMVLEIHDLIRRLSDEKLLTRSAQMDALQYQINPHFVYNTLQTIEAVGEVYNIAEVQTMAQSLGRILRYNLRGGPTVRLRDEVEQVETYLSIEKIRHADRIDWHIQVDEAALSCQVLKFILQPIVENCVLHGFRNQDVQGLITLSAAVSDVQLHIFISDNGSGISVQRLAEINEKLRQISESSQFDTGGEYVGLYNVHKRIVNFYGAGYGLTYTSNESLGTTVVLTLPRMS